MAVEPYRWLAEYYDHLFEHHRPFHLARRRILAGVAAGTGSVCDLCCGTGSLAVEFARLGMRTYAIDASPAMCRIARRKARAASVRLRVIQADMRSFSLPEPVDLITCEYDALNHVPRRRDLPRVLACAAASLRPGGHFYFDVNNRLAFERGWNQTWFIDKDPVAAVFRMTAGKDRAAADIHWFIRKGQAWQRRHEHVEEVCWSRAEMRSSLRAAGFEALQAWDAAPFFNDQFTRPGYRTFWLARKAG